MSLSDADKNSQFQSTHPHGVRRRGRWRSLSSCRFNPRTHTGCDITATCFSTAFLCFNPRTHTGCDIPFLVIRHPVIVSIHAPTRGATRYKRMGPHSFLVSIHAPTRGATASLQVMSLITLMFQSTHPHGVRRRVMRMFLESNGFNPRTHTGCDFAGCAYCASCLRFNPRTHTGCDPGFLC